MKHVFLTIPTGPKVGLSTVSIGLVRALDKRGVRVSFFKPINQSMGSDDGKDRSVHFIRSQTPLNPPDPITLEHARDLIGQNRSDDLMEEVVRKFEEASADSDAVVVEGLLQTAEFPLGAKVNRDLSKTLSASVILVSQLGGQTIESLNSEIELVASDFDGVGGTKIVGSIINKADLLVSRKDFGFEGKDAFELRGHLSGTLPVFKHTNFDLIGVIPIEQKLLAPRTADVAKLIGAEVICKGEMDTRRVANINLCARTVANMMHVFKAGNLLVTPSDRDDVVLAASMAALNGVQLAGLVLTGELPCDANVMSFCRKAWDTGLPVLKVPTSSFETAKALSTMNPEIAADDGERADQAMELVARHIRPAWIRESLASVVAQHMSPPAFRHRLSVQARKDLKQIILPEGDEPRTLEAAVACVERGIAECVLLANPEAVRQQAYALGIELPSRLSIVDPNLVRESYVPFLVEARKRKNITPGIARNLLEDNVMLGTSMLATGEVDGLVSGAVHSTANTVRPALQIIKTRPGAKVVSSIFFMCLPDQVLVYGDCAINPNPNAEELADIAIQSADSAKALGIEPIVAMISYSTLGSGSGADVDKVVEATRIVQELRPDLLVDGPLQYDAASTMAVAKNKAPDSPVAGRATVFIFPDLNTGNTTYKAVQRSANVVSIGPMLQGLKKPVNDLSRGALVDDIIYTIALTAIQAQQD